MMSLRIGLVTGEYPPMEGGVGAYTRELAAALAALGHEVHVITDRRARPEGATRDFWNPRDPAETEIAWVHARINRWWWAANNAVADVALRYDLDVVNIQYQAAAFDMHLPAINFLPWRIRDLASTVVTFHDLKHPYLFPKAGRLRTLMVKRLAHSADGVIVTNGEDQARLLEDGLASERLRQIPIGSNVSVHTASQEQIGRVRRALDLANSDCLLGFFGFINASKGPDLLLAALAKLPERFRLAFIGGKTGSSDATNRAYLGEIEALIESEGLEERVRWSGYLDDAELSAYFSACDIMVMPYRDGVSLRRGTLMAILAHGRPLITSLTGSGDTPFVHGQNIWMTAVDDPVVLSEAILQVAADEALRNRLSSGARMLSERFGWDRIAAETASFYQEVCAGTDEPS